MLSGRDVVVLRLSFGGQNAVLGFRRLLGWLGFVGLARATNEEGDDGDEGEKSD